MLLSVVLPLALAFIMFSLGLGLTVQDFVRVIRRPAALAAGLGAQMLALPLIAWALIALLGQGLPQELKLGVMILAFCPGGVTSNIMTRFARGDVALSVSLTGVMSLLSVLTMPLLAAWAVARFLTNAPEGAVFLSSAAAGLGGVEVDVTSLGLAMFLITALPVAVGVLIRRYLTGLAERASGVVYAVATVLFVVIVVGALAANWEVFVANVGTLAPIVIALNIVMLAVGYALARALRLDAAGSTAIAIEAGVQNGTLGITVGQLISVGVTGLPPIAVPSGIYGITMYAVTLPFVAFRHLRARGPLSATDSPG
ncbi:MAG: bile acid:sodium symporter family protein [Pseudomonadota bacterium]